MAPIPPHQFTLRSVGRTARVSCQSVAELDLLLHVYGSMQCNNSAGADLEYTVDVTREPAVFRITRPGRPPLFANDDGELIYLLEKDLTIELQHLRHDLYFVHAAVLAFEGNAILLVAPSGQGKSTTTWALLHHGFDYLSDELAPVDLRTMEVLAYPHALCLKNEPPCAYPLPSQAVRTERTLHVPTSALPAKTVTDRLPITKMIFLGYCSDRQAAPELKPISKAEAGARLYAQALNALAHREDGLHAAELISRKADCYRLRSADLRSTCGLLTSEFFRDSPTELGLQNESRPV